jgi:hypothetical protein
MKYTIQINQLAIIQNEFNIKGTTLDTWALFDFLLFFNGAKNHKTLSRNGITYLWINYNYIQENMPLCNFYKQAIKKHLDLLQEIGLIELIKDESNNVYFTFTKLMERLFVSDEKSTHLSKNLHTPRENFTQPLSKNLPTININNIEDINNNTLKNLDNLDIENSLEKENFLKKEKNIKKEKKSISEQALELYQPNQYFTLDDWCEWVEYKQARCKNLTLQTFKQNFKFLINLGSSAKASISQSINHNYQGLFEVKQTNANSQNQGYFKGLSAKEQFASVADGSYNADDYDFSKLPIYS